MSGTNAWGSIQDTFLVETYRYGQPLVRRQLLPDTVLDHGAIWALRPGDYVGNATALSAAILAGSGCLDDYGDRSCNASTSLNYDFLGIRWTAYDSSVVVELSGVNATDTLRDSTLIRFRDLPVIQKGLLPDFHLAPSIQATLELTDFLANPYSYTVRVLDGAACLSPSAGTGSCYSSQLTLSLGSSLLFLRSNGADSARIVVTANDAAGAISDTFTVAFYPPPDEVVALPQTASATGQAWSVKAQGHQLVIEGRGDLSLGFYDLAGHRLGGTLLHVEGSSRFELPRSPGMLIVRWNRQALLIRPGTD